MLQMSIRIYPGVSWDLNHVNRVKHWRLVMVDVTIL